MTSSRSDTPTHLRASDICKRFGGAYALEGVDFSVERGEIVGLVGENGAGKSTLVKILTGAIPPSSGQIEVDGAPVTFSSLRAARESGVSVVYQDSQLFPALRVWENLGVTSGHLPRKGPFVDRSQARDAARRVLERFDTSIDADAYVGALSPIERRLVEIARALAEEPTFLLLDEPTAALEQAESHRLLEMLRHLRSQGTGLVLVSHHLDEVERLADRVVVLRDGHAVAELRGEEIVHDRLVTSMLGHAPAPVCETQSPPGDDVAIEITDLQVLPGASAIDLEVRCGEIVAITGLVGSGTSNMLEHLVGGGTSRSAEVKVDGVPTRLNSPVAALRSGIGFLAQDRKRAGALESHSVVWNVALASLPQLCSRGWRRNRRMLAVSERMRQRLDLRCASLQQPMGFLSGGNQQKVLLARWLAAGIKVFAIDEPTQGVDIGARADIANDLREFAAAGGTVLFASSDLYEIQELATRVLVLRRGELVADIHASAGMPTQETILTAMSGRAESPRSEGRQHA